MLQAKVTHLRAPAQEKGRQGQHGWDVAYSDVGDVDAPVQRVNGGRDRKGYG